MMVHRPPRKGSVPKTGCTEWLDKKHYNLLVTTKYGTEFLFCRSVMPIELYNMGKDRGILNRMLRFERRTVRRHIRRYFRERPPCQ